MAILRAKDIIKMEDKELAEKLADMRKELMKLCSQIATGTRAENPGRIRAIKRTIARIKTIKGGRV